ncbi:MAG: ATP synthase F1 subunit delta [Syntrophomonadaceae bacterium]|jgi:F-type H+-transporting ATPase subunit delta
MLNISVARRYAEAFFNIARESNKVDEYQQELELVVETIKKVENLEQYFAHLLIPVNEKKAVIDKIFADKISPVTLNFIKVVVDKRREAYLSAITEQYIEMADEFRSIAKLDFITAVEVSKKDVQFLAERLSKSTGKKIQLRLQVDPTLIGGVRLRMGDQIIDGSVANKLQRIKEKLKQASIS